MPQMMPMYWLILFLYFLIIYIFIIMMMNYFFYIIKINNNFINKIIIKIMNNIKFYKINE